MNEQERVDLPPEVAEAVLRLLDEPDPLTALAAVGDVPAEARDLLEVWAALPVALEPHLPSAATRESLLASAGAASVESAARALQQAEAPATEPLREPYGDPTTFQGRRGIPWLLPLAATLIVGLLGVSAWLWTRLDVQSERIARLTERVTALSETRSSTAVDARLAAMEEYLRIVSTPGVEVCPLRLTAVESESGRARGILYVAPDHQHWYLALSGLRQAPEGKAYHLWFFVDEQPVSAGSFEARPGEVVRLGSDTMPEGTHAVGITLEPRRDVEQPSGEPILFGDEVMRVA